MDDFTHTSSSANPPASPASPLRRLLSHRRWALTVATLLLIAVIGLSVRLTTSPSAAAVPVVASSTPAAGPIAGGGGSNARSGPAAGGASGTVGAVSTSSFTLTTSAGQKVTVKKASSTKYEKGNGSISASAIKNGASVLVLGTTSGTTITATQVMLQPSGGTAPATAATVVAFKRGAPSTAKTAGKIPASYSEGSGTIVSGTTANKATEAALAAYPGGVVDRVVRLSNGEYEVHNIGVNWPHHVFVSKDFKVVGAE
jgi:hypothetical protein